jgi:hypothetical protein
VARSRTPICLMCVPEGAGGTDIYRRLQQGKVSAAYSLVPLWLTPQIHTWVCRRRTQRFTSSTCTTRHVWRGETIYVETRARRRRHGQYAQVPPLTPPLTQRRRSTITPLLSSRVGRAGLDGAVAVSAWPLGRAFMSGNDGKSIEYIREHWDDPETVCAAGCTALASLYGPRDETELERARYLYKLQLSL